jgi:ABC-type nitrate/sulfonate/bicarbonate transport system substrate-binding protein
MNALKEKHVRSKARTRFTALLIPACIAVVGLSGCGGSSAPRPSNSAASASPNSAAQPSAIAQSPATPKPSGATHLTIPYTALTANSLQYWVANDLGLYKKYGLDVDIEYVATSTTVTAAMLSGQTPVSDNGEDAVISADLGGGDLAIIGAGWNKLLLDIYSTPAIKAPKELKGKRLGVSKQGTVTDFAGRYFLTKNGLVPNTDVTLVQTGGAPQTLTALQSGAIDAGVFGSPNDYQAKAAGFSELANLADYDIAYHTGPLVAKRSWLTTHHGDALNVMRAYLEAVDQVYRDKSKAIAILGKYMKTSDTALLEDSYTSTLRGLPRMQLPEIDALKVGLQQSELPAAKTADPAQFIDTSLVNELQASGFFTGLGR